MFGIIIYGLAVEMNCFKQKNISCNYIMAPSVSDKWRFTLYTTLVLVLLFNPWTYNLTNSLLSNLVGNIANKGCPTMFGFVVHVVVFTVIIRYMMDLNL